LKAANNLAWLITQNGGNIDEALALAQKCKEKAPNNPKVADNLGWIYLKKNNVKMAITQFQDSLRVDPKSQEVLYHLGVAQFRSGNMPEATRSLSAALSGTPDYPGVADARHVLQSIQHGR
jgi:tetratricopeptide (TPR) repeat protein